MRMNTTFVIPDRRAAASPESIITVAGAITIAGAMDSGPAGFVRVPE
jgi:hypothetical protein